MSHDSDIITWRCSVDHESGALYFCPRLCWWRVAGFPWRIKVLTKKQTSNAADELSLRAMPCCGGPVPNHSIAFWFPITRLYFLKPPLSLNQSPPPPFSWAQTASVWQQVFAEYSCKEVLPVICDALLLLRVDHVHPNGIACSYTMSLKLII